jgi:hypothetical protein
MSKYKIELEKQKEKFLIDDISNKTKNNLIN